jgi:hypothetical protein
MLFMNFWYIIYKDDLVISYRLKISINYGYKV